MSAEQEALERAIGYKFHDPGLLRRALTHRSFSAERQTPDPLADNEQLEFLGDAVLGFVISELLFHSRPAQSEGSLTRLKARLVSSAQLYEAALRFDLGKYLLLGKGEERSGGRSKPTVLANALEALIAAIYLDGGLEAARSFILTHVCPEPDSWAPLVNYKGALQELAQARGLPAPRYTVVGEHGPDHARTFTVEVRMGEKLCAQAQDHTKKDAGQKAARLLLEKLLSTPSPR